MTIPDEPSKRRVIPRWREAAIAIETGEGRPLGQTVLTVDDHQAALRSLDRLHAAFAAEPNIGTAAELLSFAQLLDTTEPAEDAAEYLLMHAEHTTPATLKAARQVLGIDQLVSGTALPATAEPQLSVGTLGVQVGELRARLRIFPANALAHLDLARLHTALGNDKQADRHLRVALGLAPRHRLTIRAVTRFLIHIGQAERALRFLRGLDVVRHDPWLMASEISTATVAGRPQQLLRRAREVVENQQHEALQISELAASLATLEVLNGHSTRRVRQLMQRALEDPTENTMAQARWVGQRVRLDQAQLEMRVVPRNFEARAWQAYHELQFEASRDLFTEWLRDEPFSSRPALMAGYLTGLLDPTPQRAIDLARLGTAADERDATLRNNLAFFLAGNNQLDQAEGELTIATGLAHDDLDQTMIRATRGFIAFRRGDSVNGARLYQEAVGLARAQNNERLALTAQLYFAREATLSNLPDAAILLVQAIEDIQRQPVLHPDVAVSLMRVSRDLGLPAVEFSQ